MSQRKSTAWAVANAPCRAKYDGKYYNATILYLGTREVCCWLVYDEQAGHCVGRATSDGCAVPQWYCTQSLYSSLLFCEAIKQANGHHPDSLDQRFRLQCRSRAYITTAMNPRTMRTSRLPSLSRGRASKLRQGRRHARRPAPPPPGLLPVCCGLALQYRLSLHFRRWFLFCSTIAAERKIIR